MSVRPLTCRDCRRECTLVRVAPFAPQGDETTYAVAWRCPQCDRQSLDVCPLGPLVPSESLCLNCGAAYGGDGSPCASCGLPRDAVRAALGVETVPADRLAAARAAFARGLIRRGIAVLNLALRDDPALAEAWSLKCAFLDSLGFVRARAAMLEAALAAGGPPPLWVSYGYALQEQDRHADAVAAYGRYLELLPAGPWAAVAWGNRANSLARLGDHTAAEEAYRRALALEPGRASHARNYALFLRDNNRPAEALSVLDAARECATDAADRASLLEDRAALLTGKEQAAEALASLDAALALGADTARAHYLRGRALGLLGRPDEARSAILRVLEIDPGHAEARRALETLDAVLLWGRPVRPTDR